MKNPFNKENELEKYEFFKQMTDAINDWMLKQYPAFDTELVNKIKELRILQTEAKNFHQEMENEFLEFSEILQENVIQKINEFISKDYPDISSKLNDTVIQHEKNVKKMEEHLKEVINTKSLYEDVYKMRDEMKELKKSVENFTERLKKVFK